MVCGGILGQVALVTTACERDSVGKNGDNDKVERRNADRTAVKVYQDGELDSGDKSQYVPQFEEFLYLRTFYTASGVEINWDGKVRSSGRHYSPLAGCLSVYRSSSIFSEIDSRPLKRSR